MGVPSNHKSRPNFPLRRPQDRVVVETVTVVEPDIRSVYSRPFGHPPLQVALSVSQRALQIDLCRLVGLEVSEKLACYLCINAN